MSTFVPLDVPYSCDFAERNPNMVLANAIVIEVVHYAECSYFNVKHPTQCAQYYTSKQPCPFKLTDASTRYCTRS